MGYRLNAKVNLSLQKHYVIWGMNILNHSFFTSIMDGCNGQLHTPTGLVPGKGPQIPPYPNPKPIEQNPILQLSNLQF
jgi:hypothetical protein